MFEDRWLVRIHMDERLVAKTIIVHEEHEVCCAVEGVSQAVACAWARGRPLPKTVDELPVAMIAERFCPGEEDLVRWVAKILFRRGEMPIVGRLDEPDVETLTKWKEMFDWTGSLAA